MYGTKAMLFESNLRVFTWGNFESSVSYPSCRIPYAHAQFNIQNVGISRIQKIKSDFIYGLTFKISTIEHETWTSYGHVMTLMSKTPKLTILIKNAL